MPCRQTPPVPPRNKDFQEVTLEKEGQVLLHFAMVYGFRNIQNLVQRLKRGRCPYHYVEVMACPSGSSREGQDTRAPSGTRAVGHHLPGWEWEEVGHRGARSPPCSQVVRRLRWGTGCDPCVPSALPQAA